MQPGAYRIKENHWRFTVWAPEAEQVELLCLDTDRRFDLEKSDDGYWTRTFDLVPEEMDYRFRLNGRLERADPASGWQPEGVHGPSRIVDHAAYAWTDNQYNPVPLEDYIIYELHIGTFTPQGTFAAAAAKLDTLKELGITAVEVMPVAQFPGSRNWGYDGVYPYAVQQSYGGPQGFKDFVNAAHERGLAVILDVVYNHLGPEGNYVRDFGPYFTDHYRTPWGDAVNFDQAHSDGVRDFFIENAIFWLHRYHIDALRLDALHAIFDMSAKHFIRELVERVQQYAKQATRSCYVIGESDLNDVRLLKPAAEGGCGLDAQWSDDFHHSLHTLLTGEQFGYYQDFATVAQLAKALREGFVYDGTYSQFRKRRHGSSSRSRPARQFVVCAQNHDQVGNRMRGDRLSHLLDFEGLKLAAGCLLLAPYVPLMFMGQEYAEESPFLYFVSVNDPNLAEAIRKGRAEEFKGFQWQGDCPDPQSEETFNRSKLQWDLREKQKHQCLLEFYRRLIRLRQKQNGYVSKEGFTADAIESQRILFWHRQWPGEQWLCLMNFSDAAQRFILPDFAGQWRQILDSADARWAGQNASAPPEISSETQIEMPPKNLCLYEAMGQSHENSNRNISYSI